MFIPPGHTVKFIGFRHSHISTINPPVSPLGLTNLAKPLGHHGPVPVVGWMMMDGSDWELDGIEDSDRKN